MLPSDCTKQKHIDYKIAEINSYNKNADTYSDVMSIGKNSHGYEARILIKFNFNHLPENTRILNASLSIFVTKGTKLELQGYNLNSEWNVRNINWINQPSIDFSTKVFEKTISKCGKYYIDLTDQVNHWFEYPEDNYGLVLMSTDMSGYDYIQICTEKRTDDNLSLLLAYCVEADIHIVPKFFEYREDIKVSQDSEYFTTGCNISLVTTVSYFIKNNTNASITVIAENSPDDVNYAKEIQTIIIPTGSCSLLVPINFSKYIRLSISVPPCANTAIINIWLNLQQ
ncbi:MAG: hypothetical protein K0S01_3554 [Herbinix sp.]|jgi:hypothetical protein|nr:hypothetical protein [Herbinix sp.]